MWWTIVLLVIAVWMLVHGIISTTLRIIEFVKIDREINLTANIIFITIGLSYILWWCN